MPGEHLFTTSTIDGNVVVTIGIDRIDAAIADDLKAGMREAVSRIDKHLIVDMGAVEFVDSSGLGALVSVRKQLRADRQMRLQNPSPFVHNALRLTKLDKVFVV